MVRSARLLGVSVLVLTHLVLTALPGNSAAQGSDVEFSAGVRTWITSGYTKWNFAGAGISPLSELRWRGTDSVALEVNGELVWKRLVLQASLGAGAITDGVLIDDDFLQSDYRARFSHTRSRVDDDSLSYATADLGYRLLTWGGEQGRPKGSLGFLIGYQYWAEEYVAFGITGSSRASTGTKVITHEYEFHSVRLGARAQVPLWRALSLKARSVLLPWSSSHLDDVHHLRTDLKKNPSFSSDAEGGLGVDLDGSLAYGLGTRLTVEAGYRYFRLDSGSGDKFTHALTGTTRDRLNEIIIERHGPHVSLTYRF